MPHDLPKAYEPKHIEQKWYPFWEQGGYFQPQGTGQPFCIVIPPPNVTGSLHMGHALQHALMDVLIRWRRMQGRCTLWLPGTDHAGIATQMVVEKQLAAEGIKRTDLTRAGFEARVWDWKAESGGTIQRQMRLEGVSVDWSRERFTLDEGLSQAVREVFVRLYEEGRIYRGAYMVNWSPKLQTAVSDLEVEMKEVRGKLYHLAYPVIGREETIIVATTRPETMLGDTAVAVHPADDRYRHLIGQRVRLPIVGRDIPIIADEAVEIGFGTGAVKVTPAHDPNDFELSKRHGLEFIVVIGKDGTMTEAAGAGFAGLDRFKAREKVIQQLAELGALVKVEDYTHNVGHCQRSGVPIEPLVSEQWFLDVKPLAEKAIVAVREGRTRFIPSSWEKVYFDWMENIRPWCISRQLWWGHRIPAWYAPDGRLAVARSEAEARHQLGLPDDAPMTQDEDVLDTWFSSALWAFSTFGWTGDPARDAANPDLQRFTPTDVLVTGFDIIFFWVARMMMMSLHFTGDVPFRCVFVTGLVRDAQGQKMSKTKGNVVDPLEVFEKYGTDAVRFSLVSAVTGANDIKLQESKMEAARNFANKIWNAARFTLGNLPDPAAPLPRPEDKPGLADRWMQSRLTRVTAEVTEALENFRFHDATLTLYKFFWNDFCDWYIELVKPVVSAAEDTPERTAARARLAATLEHALRLLHPFMPFITEELWQQVSRYVWADGERPSSLCMAPYPKAAVADLDLEAERQMEAVINLISRVRNIRAEMNLPPSAQVEVHFAADASLSQLLLAQKPAILRLARATAVVAHDELPDLGFCARSVTPEGVRLALPLAGLVDAQTERARLEKEIAKHEKALHQLLEVVNRPGFAERAAPEVVAEKQEQRLALENQLAALRETLATFG
ncbi:valine--tRNA ligase [Chloracidobacterium aggregatum]|uniref:Valine--tRNA ligase n=1 Tax=Chloracidobacterium sp. N TaxID=2821540 RepID=A0ABX8B3Q9_9BACT|nr:valine--tRNA ligase [Chloracidobacterium aggregatum]QUV93751.1 valine--tRNA ligase [Chloracidobacterium sp. N]